MRLVFLELRWIILFLCSSMATCSLGQNRLHHSTSRSDLHSILSGLDKTYRKTVTTFLQTDMKGIMNFQMQLHLQAEINLYLSSIFPKDVSHSQRPSYFDQFVSTRTKLVSEMFSFLAKKANKATVLPFLIFTNFFHQRFPKHRFLESTQELLQQFYIAIEECVDNYKMFPGNQYLLSIKCMRCHNCVLSKNSE